MNIKELSFSRQILHVSVFEVSPVTEFLDMDVRYGVIFPPFLWHTQNAITRLTPSSPHKLIDEVQG